MKIKNKLTPVLGFFGKSLGAQIQGIDIARSRSVKIFKEAKTSLTKIFIAILKIVINIVLVAGLIGLFFIYSTAVSAVLPLITLMAPIALIQRLDKMFNSKFESRLIKMSSVQGIIDIIKMGFSQFLNWGDRILNKNLEYTKFILFNLVKLGWNVLMMFASIGEIITQVLIYDLILILALMTIICFSLILSIGFVFCAPIFLFNFIQRDRSDEIQAQSEHEFPQEHININLTILVVQKVQEIIKVNIWQLLETLSKRELQELATLLQEEQFRVRKHGTKSQIKSSMMKVLAA